MNVFISTAVSAVFLVIASSAAASEQQAYPTDDFDRIVGERSPYPVAPTSIMERRKMSGSAGDRFSENSSYAGGGDWPQGGLQVQLGLIAYHPFEGANTLYQCISKSSRPWNYFTSTDANCEGQSRPNTRRIIGYVYAYQHPGTAPLYRCRQDLSGKSDHYDSTLANCEGNGSTVNEGVLGYMWTY